MPTTMSITSPCCPLVFITRLASQPATAPSTIHSKMFIGILSDSCRGPTAADA